MKRVLKAILPWAITAFALSSAFRDVDWTLLLSHLGEADRGALALGVFLTGASYFMRARRWQALFPNYSLPYFDSARVLTLGFFMNNVLPARAGEFVRAHLGAQISKKSRALVLGTIASERLVDGLTISLMYVLFAQGLGEASVARNLFLVALFFVAATTVALLMLWSKEWVYRLGARIEARLNHRASTYAIVKIRTFIDGLSPLASLSNALPIVLWSVVIWSNELTVYALTSGAYGLQLSLPEVVLFMVAVNFASLIPAAPGGIGVIEYVGSLVLISVGVPKELALIVVLTQHAIQYLVVGLPGIFLMLTWRSRLARVRQAFEEEGRAESEN